MAAHFFGSLAQAGRLAIHVEASGRDAHHVAEAAYKAVGRALRDRAAASSRRASRRRRACCEGRRLRLPRRQHPLGRDRAAPARRRARRRRRGRRPRRAAGRRLGRARRWPSCARQGLDDALRARIADERPVLGICLGLQLALEHSEEDGGVDGLGILPGRSVRLHRGPRAADRLGRGRRHARTTSRTPTPPRRRARPRGRRASSPRRARARSSACSSTRRRAAPPARATSTACCGGEGAIPLPRLIPCLDVAAGRVVKGVKFQGLRDVGDPVELGAAYSDRGADELVFLDVKATLEERDTLVGVVRARRRAARDPVHGRRRHPHGRRRRRAALGRRRQGLGQLGGARARRR